MPKKYVVRPYVSKTGPIPPNNFENEMTAPTPIEKFMSKEDVEAFRAETEALRIKAANPKPKT